MQNGVFKYVVIYHGVGKDLQSLIKKGAVGVQSVQNFREKRKFEPNVLIISV